jgi:REP element-mobilizing transposase RayT
MPRRSQLSLALEEKKTWGGKRKGAGRKPAGERALVSRRKRPTLSGRHPVHATLRVLPEIPSLRVLNVCVRRALIAGASKPGFRLVHYSIQSNHIHLIVEADTTVQLSRGMQGIALRISNAVNKAMSGRSGKVFSDRYHEHVLSTPRETRAALRYVLENHRKHRLEAGRRLRDDFLDEHSTAACFVGLERSPLPAARFWLLTNGHAIDGPLTIAGFTIPGRYGIP